MRPKRYLRIEFKHTGHDCPPDCQHLDRIFRLPGETSPNLAPIPRLRNLVALGSSVVSFLPLPLPPMDGPAVVGCHLWAADDELAVAGGVLDSYVLALGDGAPSPTMGTGAEPTVTLLEIISCLSWFGSAGDVSEGSAAWGRRLCVARLAFWVA